MTATIPCRVRRGNFASEWLVAVTSREGGEVSFFVDRAFVRSEHEPQKDEEVEGLLKVAVVRQEDQNMLVQLPTIESDTGRVWVPQQRLQPMH